MKKTTESLFYLCITFLLFLSACNRPDLVIELPPEDTPVPEVEAADPEDALEEPSEVEEVNLADMLGVGSAMKWYDDGYLVFVPAGEVTLGDNEYENNPVHNVDLDDYWIYMFKVTNGQYRHCIATGTCTPPAAEDPYPDIDNPAIKDQPVIGVTWEQAETYCEWMNGKLPTKAQWEKAARGPEANTYPWGEEDPDCDLLNYGDCENPAITEVYEYPEGRSFYQAFDLAGNAYEWVFDLYEDDFIAQLPFEFPAGPPDGTERSVRGSSYVSEEELIPSAQLFYLEPERYRTDLGFRCVLGEAVPKSFASPCIQTAFVDGLPAPWQPGPPTGENDLPDLDERTCPPEKDIRWIPYCISVDTQTGGGDLYITGLNDSDAYLKSYGSNGSVYCEEANDPIGCFGPDGAAVTFEICASCTPLPNWETLVFGCDCGFTLTHTDPPTCVYDGGPPVPGGTCPAGFVYDPVEDICVELVDDSEDCPAGYEYNPDTECCVASFAEPSPDSQGDSSSYLTCPPGYGNVQLDDTDSTEGQWFATCHYLVFPTSDIEDCEEVTYNLGICKDPTPPPPPPTDEPRCTDPSSYTAEGPCRAAGCDWFNIAGRPGVCTFPP